MTDQHAGAPRTEEARGHCAVPQNECRALVRVNPPGQWDDAGLRMVLAACYFGWLGYLTAFLPLLLLNLRVVKRREELAYQVYASTAWSVVVAAANALLLGLSVWAGTTSGPTAEAICNAVNLVKLVLVLAFALLMSIVWGVEALIGRRPGIPWVSDWARARAEALTSGA